MFNCLFKEKVKHSLDLELYLRDRPLEPSGQTYSIIFGDKT